MASEAQQHTQEAGRLFGPAFFVPLRTAVRDLSWLLGRGYNETSALKLVGDRHGLTALQRKAVLRCSCSDQALAHRWRRRLERGGAVDGRRLHIDGLNCLITLQSAYSGGVILVGRDRCCRDLASVHGSFRATRWARRAVRAIGQLLGKVPVTWYLDRPVSGSGQLSAVLADEASNEGWPWAVELHRNPDQVLAEVGSSSSAGAVVTSDSWVLDHCGAWIDLAGEIIRDLDSPAWVLDLGSGI